MLSSFLFMVQIIKYTKNKDFIIKTMCKAIEENKIFIYPTDTVYGIGGNALSKEVKARIDKIKKRDSSKRYSIIVPTKSYIYRLCRVNSYAKECIKKYLPGPYTIILPLKKAFFGRKDEIGIRMVDLDFLKKAIRKAKKPIITTSVNVSGGVPAKSIDEISKEILDKVDYVFDFGEIGSGKPSTLINTITKEKIVRD